VIRNVVAACFALLAGSLLASTEACGTACRQVGCTNSVIARLELPKPLAELTGARITVCQGDDCNVRPLVLPCVTESDLRAGDLRLFCYREPADSARDDVVTVSFIVPEAETATAGRVFTFFVTDGAGILVVQRSGPAMYADAYPNGPSCGAACRQSRLN
jgi:hypothetical protein